MKRNSLRILTSALSLGMFVTSLVVLRRQLAAHHLRDILQHISSLPPRAVILALVFTLLSYVALTACEVLACWYIRRPLSFGRIAIASFISNAFNNTVGFASLSGGIVRSRLYAAWGLTAAEIALVIIFCAGAFWLGFLGLAGVAFVVEPLRIPAALQLPLRSIHVLGWICLVLLAAYLAATLLRKRPIKIGNWELSCPSLTIGLGQVAASSLDWLCAAAALSVLLPVGRPAFPVFLGLFLLAQLAGVGSQVPGGLGVFEMTLVVLLSPGLSAAQTLGALVAYRAVYYVLPLVLGAALLGLHELLERRAHVARLAGVFGRWVPELAPQVLAVTTFVGGLILLMSGATPSVPNRLEWLNDLVPLPVTELSHFLASLAGAGLLLLASGLYQRLDAAYVSAVLLLGAGIVFSLLKGFDYEEAIELAIMLGALLPCRAQFYRKGSLINERFSPGWIVAIGLALFGTIWLGLFAYKHVEYSHELWWQFSLSGDAPRFLRASVGVISIASWAAAATLLRPARHSPLIATEDEVARARRIVDHAPCTYAYLALLGDKSLLWNARGTTFLMYGVQGQSWVALGDPVGEAEERQELVWQFRELCDQYHGRPVFYDIGAEHLPLYLDVGLTLLKIGEEARVPLPSFSLEGGGCKDLRYTHRKVAREGYEFEVVGREQVPGLLPDLQAISDEWLAAKQTREKRFSLGFFSPPYLRQCALGLVRREGRLVAFANLWLGAKQEELSVDLMRYRPDAPAGVMDYLFIELMRWGQLQGYRWFNLGTVPLSGFEPRALATVWSRLGAFVFRHGEHFYNFQGLRQYKDKFAPVWDPRYVACPGGLAVPGILLDLAALISGGVTGIVAK